jgi:ParB/RepB/Spo0J family partition protein
MKRKSPNPASQSLALSQPPELPPPPPSPEVQQIPLSTLTPSLYQPRQFLVPDSEDPELIQLARSIRAKGVIQPILARPMDGGHEIVFGERRVRASRLALPELDAIGPAQAYIPAIVRELSDTEAAELIVEENLRRNNLRPLEEASGVHTLLLLHKGDPYAVAAKLGQTPAWVACRARIHSHLSGDWKELLSAPDSPLGFWTAAHVEEIAKLAPEVQDEILGNFTGGIDPSLTVPDLRRYLADLTRDLGRAPFPLDDDTLHPSAGACTSCPLTTLATPLLFADQGDAAPDDIKKARCLNRSCWIEKCHRSAERAAARLRSEHPNLLLVAPPQVAFEELPAGWRGDTVLRSHTYEKVKKNTEGAEPAMLAAGPQAGKLIWIKPKYPPRRERQELPLVSTSEPVSPETVEAPPAPVVDLLAERRRKHMNRRVARMAELTRDQLEAFDGKTLSLPTLAGLATVFGTNMNRKGIWHFGPSSDPWAELDNFSTLEPEEAATTLWAIQLQPVLVSRLQYAGPADAARLHREVIGALKLIGASYPELYRAVARELPEPKAWAKYPDYVPEDLEGEPPLPVAQSPELGTLVVEFGPEGQILDEETGEDEAVPA